MLFIILSLIKQVDTNNTCWYQFENAKNVKRKTKYNLIKKGIRISNHIEIASIFFQPFDFVPNKNSELNMYRIGNDVHDRYTRCCRCCIWTLIIWFLLQWLISASAVPLHSVRIILPFGLLTDIWICYFQKPYH